MWEHTARLAATWARVTLALAAVLLDLLVLHALWREWAWQARGSWWRFW